MDAGDGPRRYAKSWLQKRSPSVAATAPSRLSLGNTLSASSNLRRAWDQQPTRVAFDSE
jgi:hypothetical protein